ncbi:DUF6275 family protein [Anaerococcus porci]|uniref:Uncharacterized protein n=1 Tax=Anaerococcus porci TaxID=2652269 RepID=A0A6N7VTA9_9FIRM|nr:DUF6275 family protein [Anaerococcus porci]MDY3006010.1 DUF6275 family protein [Anaerococcus porci]MSS77057.1 hypothetical protein [Anaerococcus porci]
MKHEDFIEIAKREVVSFEACRVEIPLDISEQFDVKDVFVVWSCKTLQNSKALLSMPHKGALYYEFTLNGDKEEIYMNAYRKLVNKKLDKNYIKSNHKDIYERT